MKCIKLIVISFVLLGIYFPIFSQNYVWDYPDPPRWSDWCQIMTDLGKYEQVICDTIGTSVNGKVMHCLTISTNPEERGEKPKFQWTAGIHGNETSPIMNAPWMCDWLVNNYETDERAKLILDSVIIKMVALHNPDGCYANGDNTFGGERTNANSVDMNRNYPYPTNFPDLGTNPATVAKETQNMMDMYNDNVFTLGWGWHSGFEGFSVPWTCVVGKHKDFEWYDYVCRNFIDQVQDLGGSDYWSAYSNGMAWTDGGYKPIQGTGKDWICYFGYARGNCPEISDKQQLTSANEYQRYWDWTYEACLDYILEILNGIRGRVHVAGKGVRAKVFVDDHDDDINGVDYHSYVFSDSTGNGCYTRMMYQGTYSVTYTVEADDSPDGKAYDTTVTGIVVENGKKTHVDVLFAEVTGITSIVNSLTPADIKIRTLNRGVTITLGNNYNVNADIYNASGKLVRSLVSHSSAISWNGLSDNGSRVGPGCYVLHLKAKNGNLQKAFMLY